MTIMDWNTSGVYAVYGPSGAYVGSSKSVMKRWSHHNTMLKRGDHSCRTLQSDYDVGGDIRYVLLEACDVSTIREREAHWGRTIDVPVINAAIPGSTVWKRTPEVKAKVSAAALRQWATPERLRRKYAMLECIDLGMKITHAQEKFGFSHSTIRKWIDA